MAMTSPVGWANRAVSRRLAHSLLPCLRPAVLVVSLPRSGSSWVGDVLGASPGAMYLREPLTQPYLDSQNRAGLSFQWVDPSDPPPGYAESAAAAFVGLPAFDARIVRMPDQWRLTERRRRRPVIKEVNPFALPWLRDTYGPSVIYLIRHPAAVAASFARLGWGARLRERVPAASLPDGIGDGEPWAESAALQAVTLRFVLESLEPHDRVRIVRYEDLCIEPLRHFRTLYDFAPLPWTSEVAAHVTARSAHDQVDDRPYPVAQPSAEMANAWRHRLLPEQIATMRETWTAFDLPFYGVEDW